MVFFFFLLFLIMLMGCKALGRHCSARLSSCSATSFAPAFSLLKRCSEVPLPCKPAALHPAETQDADRGETPRFVHLAPRRHSAATYSSVFQCSPPPNPCHWYWGGLCASATSLSLPPGFTKPRCELPRHKAANAKRVVGLFPRGRSAAPQL